MAFPKIIKPELYYEPNPRFPVPNLLVFHSIQKSKCRYMSKCLEEGKRATMAIVSQK